jgi:non-ribosomal peptide synthetase component F
MTDTPPDWALIEAAKRAGLHLTPAQYRARLIAKAAQPYFLALCDMIVKHEQPPVDRKLLCAREAMAGTVLFDPVAIEGIVSRAIELWEEGFGK